MQLKNTIQAKLDAYLKREGITINQFAGISGVNSGTLSSIINGNRPVAVKQLDRITAGMGLPEGEWYELYIDEYVVRSTPDWRRLGPFLQRCAELDKLECIRQVVRIIMDNISYAQAVFEMGEEWFAQGKRQAAALLYESVAESEKYQHSERLALCQYRLFKIALGKDQEANLRAAMHFEYFVERLDEADQLNALKDLANIYASLHRWNNVDVIAEVMGRKASIQYQNKYHKASRRAVSKETGRPLCFYILYSYLLRSAVCAEHGDYGQALHYVSRYSDFSWVQERTEEARQIMEQFREWAEANTYLYRLMSGETAVLADYVEFISTRENEIIPGLTKIMQAANRFGLNVDPIIERFESRAGFKEQRTRMGKRNVQVTEDQYAVLLYELSVYYLKNQRVHRGLVYLFQSLDLSVRMNSDSGIVGCVALFEQYRHLSSVEDRERYKILIGEVQKINEKKIGAAAGNR
ncbi:helix-turn-helix domain-containing protein [Paenibacillus jilunlii]|uniref:DNA-binding protein n=1 Tax=Paenibacillus jilunlii TaxID=682956 RepID=A0A1G9Z4G0_9BACL|nr:helix-turn-helix transcriptional regulator [Paenibacillus jilunlii]KWX79504.1 DNA-binding protein [Paenibacillus jilunlii]SDN15516.1 Plasmid maintenance system antidote protein VapI, contains XRE-type HTH domain [Paenibacillus jilunlii]